MARDPHRSSLDRARAEEHRQALVTAAVASLVLHYPLLQLALAIAGLHSASKIGFEPIWVSEVELIEGLDTSEEEERRKEEEKRRRERDRVDGQVVSVPPRPSDPRDDDEKREPARFLARTDHRTAKQTKKTGDPLAGRGVSSAGRATDAPPGIELRATPPQDIEPPKLRDRAPREPLETEEAEEQAMRRSLRRRPDAQLELAPEAEVARERRESVRGDPAQSDEERDRPGARGYEALLPPLLGAGLRPGTHGTDDYLPDVEEGEETVLNTRRFKYWSFFQRTKESLRRIWRPGTELRRVDPSGRVYGVRDRMTVVSVVLGPDGTLDQLSILEESGVDALDAEAIRAFRVAQPFPNPPQGLADEDGRIRFAFGFYLDIDNGWDFRPLRIR